MHSLDGRFGLKFTRGAQVSGELFVEALNLIHSPMGEPDRALYLIDRGGSMLENSANGVVTLPLVTNPNFGKPLSRTDAGRTLRVGLQLGF